MESEPSELPAILEVLKENPRGMSVRQISEAIGMNRVTVARYLDVLRTSGRVEMVPYGQAKVYFLSHRVPISALLDFSSDCVIVLGNDRKIVHANSKMLELFDLKLDALSGVYIDDLMSPDNDEKNLAPFIDAALSGREVIEEICIQKGNTDICFEMKIIPAVFEDGAPGLTIIFHDITERKRTEEMILIQRDLAWQLSATQSLSVALPLCIRTARYVLNIESGGVYLRNGDNGDFELVYSEGLNDLFRTKISTISAGSHLGRDIISGRPIYGKSTDIKFGEGTDDILGMTGLKSLAIIPLPDNGKVIGCFSLGSYIPDDYSKFNKREIETLATYIGSVISRIKTQEDLRLSEKKYKTLFNYCENPVFVHNFRDDIKEPGRIIEVNNAACNGFGYSRNELYNMSILDLDCHLSDEDLMSVIEDLKQEKVADYRTIYRNKEGVEVPVSVRSHLFDFDKNSVILSVANKNVL